MDAKKGQISMNMIVYVSVALLVLVLIVAFATGGIGQLFQGLTTTGKGDLEVLKDKCTITCENAKSSVSLSGTSSWATSTYCTEIYGFDNDGSGTLDENEFYSCWENPISIGCSTTVQTPAGAVSLDEAECPATVS